MPVAQQKNIFGEWEDVRPAGRAPQDPPPSERHRIVHVDEVTLRPDQLQLWPACVAAMPEEERRRHFGDLPKRARLFGWEVAQFFHVSPDTVERWGSDGTIFAINVARRTCTRPDFRYLRYSVIELYVSRMEGVYTCK